MKILLLTTHLNIGGIASYSISLARALKAKGHDVMVCSSGGVLVHELTSKGVSHIRFNISTKSELSPKVLKTAFEVAAICRRLGIDIIHAQTRVTQVAGLIASRLSRARLVTTCHGFFRKNIGRMILPAWGERVIAISEPVRDQLVREFKVRSDRIELIYNGIDIKRFLRDIPSEERESLRERFGIKKGCAVLGTIARFTPDKGHDTLLYALYKIVRDIPDIMLVFIGDGKERFRIIDMVQRLGLSEHVVFIKPMIDTLKALSIIDIFMFTPRRREGLGLAMLEALAAGRPVVATNVGGIPAAVKDGVNGFLVPPSAPDAIVEPVMRLLKDRAMYKRMAQAGRETAVEKFSIEGMTEKVEAVYREVCGGESPKRGRIA